MKENHIFVDYGLDIDFTFEQANVHQLHTHTHRSRISTDYKSEQFVNESMDMTILHYNVTLC